MLTHTMCQVLPQWNARPFSRFFILVGQIQPCLRFAEPRFTDGDRLQFTLPKSCYYQDQVKQFALSADSLQFIEFLGGFVQSEFARSKACSIPSNPSGSRFQVERLLDSVGISSSSLRTIARPYSATGRHLCIHPFSCIPSLPW